MNTFRSSILIIYTGGTIGMVADEETGALYPFSEEQLYEQLPDLDKLNHEVHLISFDPLVDSSDMLPEHWIKLAELIKENYETYDGFVILHGSDTMSYSASALSFMLKNLNKPVVFTGSQLPLGVIRTDGRDNLMTAIEIAAELEDDTPLVPEVTVYFENQLFRGNRTYKKNAEDFEAFSSPNYPVLADVGVHIKYHRNRIAKPNFKKLQINTMLCQNIAILKLYPGIGKSVVKNILEIDDLEAIVLETYGSGNAISSEWFINALKEKIDNGLIVLNITQCKGGSVEQGRYGTSVSLEKIGVVSGLDMTTEAAVTKLMHLLGQKLNQIKTKSYLQSDLRGEMSI